MLAFSLFGASLSYENQLYALLDGRSCQNEFEAFLRSDVAKKAKTHYRPPPKDLLSEKLIRRS
jgi:hypothetical protein